jgi:hypothetical protein
MRQRVVHDDDDDESSSDEQTLAQRKQRLVPAEQQTSDEEEGESEEDDDVDVDDDDEAVPDEEEEDDALDDAPEDDDGATENAHQGKKRKGAGKAPRTAKRQQACDASAVKAEVAEKLQGEGLTGVVAHYAKKHYHVPPDAVVREGRPFALRSGQEMGRVRVSKAPKNWPLDPDDLWLLRGAEDELYPYVCFFVPGSPQEEADKRRLWPVHRQVAVELAARWQDRTLYPMSEQRAEHFKPFFEYKKTSDPQVQPRLVGWAECDAWLPSAEIKKDSQPRNGGHGGDEGGGGASSIDTVAVEPGGRGDEQGVKVPGVRRVTTIYADQAELIPRGKGKYLLVEFAAN